MTFFHLIGVLTPSQVRLRTVRDTGQKKITHAQIPIRLFARRTCGEKKIVERLRFTFTPNGKREFVPSDQVFPLIVGYFLLLLLKNK